MDHTVSKSLINDSIVDDPTKRLKIWAIIPVKPFNRAKSRLAKVLSPEQRESLAIHMFRHSVQLLAGIRRFAGVIVVSRDTKALAIARDYGVNTVQESGAPELNAALLRASHVVNGLGAEGVFVMPADVPFVTTDDIEQILYLGRYNQSVVIVPDRIKDGTNSLLVTPPGLIPFAFGVGSFERHMLLAKTAQATVHVYESSRMALDIDTPPDLDKYKELTSTREIPVADLWEAQSAESGPLL